MHFNFHLSGDESPAQSRRMANAVLALGGLLAPSKSVGEIIVDVKLDKSQAVQAVRDLADRADKAAHPTPFGVQPDGIVTEKGKDPRPATMDEMLAAGHHVTQGSGRYAELVTSGIDLATGPDLTTVSTVENGKVTSTLVVDEVMTPDEVKALVDQLPPPPVPTVATPQGVTPPKLDKNGLPWAERIHSSSRAINADGTWRYRKNVPDETKREVEAELRGLVDGLVKAVNDILPPNADFSHGGVATVPPPVPMSGPEHVVPLVPTPPAPPVPTGALQRTYSDVVNLIMSRKVQPDTYVAILGMSLPEFAKHVISAPNDATLMFDALDAASQS